MPPSNSSARDILTVLNWESEHYGIRMARIDPKGITDTILRSCLAQAERQGIRIVETASGVDNDLGIQLFEMFEFRMCGIHIALEKDLHRESYPHRGTLRKASERDQDKLVSMFSNAFKDSRYYRYPLVPSDRVDDYHAIRITKGIHGLYEDECLLLEDGQDMLAFVTLKYALPTATIGLFGVNPSMTRLGYGSLMLLHLNAYLAENGVQRVFVTTQAKNTKAVRVYERSGYITKSLHVYLTKVIDQHNGY